MPRPLTFFRLPRGKVWHVSQHASPVSLCGEDFPLVSGEEQPGRPPYGGRPCPRCAEVAIEAQTALTWAELAHVARQSEVIDAEIVEDDEPVAAAEVVEDQCICGHPHADHDVTTTECWEQIPADDGAGVAYCACSAYVYAARDVEVDA